MEFGLGLMGYGGCWDDAAFAEQHGFATAGFVDSPLLGGDPMVCLGLAAQATQQMRIGTFLAVPSNRSAATTAAAVATVNRLAPGRVFMGLGTGYTSRNMFGMRPVSAASLACYAQDCRTLLAGGQAYVAGPVTNHAYTFGHTQDLYINTDSHIPIYLAADGPKALDAAGAAGDGWITTMRYSHVMATSPDVFATSSRAVQAAATRQGRQIPSYSMLSTGICILNDGESATSPRALELVGPLSMLAFHSYADNPGIAEFLPAPIQDRLAIYERDVLSQLPGDPQHRYQWTHRGHLSHLLPGEAGVLTDEIVRMMTLTGTVEEIAATLGRLEGAGLSNVSIWAPPHMTRQTVLDVELRLMPVVNAAAGASSAGTRRDRQFA